MSKGAKKNSSKKTKANGMVYLILAGVVILAVAGFVLSGLGGEKDSAAAPGTTDTAGMAVKELPAPGADLTILKADVSEKVKFYPYEADGIYMEVMAVKASDGTIRTALNTCQVCFDSGRGYYEQKGDTVVCQNCGNVFSIDDIEKVRNGCNPVPVLEPDKTDDNDKIAISGEYLKTQSDYFKEWKK